jgi:hypothetical protein
MCIWLRIVLSTVRRVGREDAIVAADSFDWAVRAGAAAELARETDDEAAAALGRLLLDRHNSAVTEAAAKALLARNDLFGADLVFGAVALGDASLNDHLLWEISTAVHEGTFTLDRRGDEVLTDGSAWGRAGLREFRAWFTSGRSPV